MKFIAPLVALMLALVVQTNASPNADLFKRQAPECAGTGSDCVVDVPETCCSGACIRVAGLCGELGVGVSLYSQVSFSVAHSYALNLDLHLRDPAIVNRRKGMIESSDIKNASLRGGKFTSS